tara:strand:- start:191 stop:1003 length:813 start_codon:yes stop_codon:yes gene_type:complete
VSLKLGVIGFGNIAKAIITPLLEQNILQPEEIICLVNSRKSFENIKNNYKFKINIYHLNSPEANLVWHCPVKLLSVKPQQLKNIKELNLNDNNKYFLISILAGVSLKNLETIFPKHNCIRAVTNIPITVGQGLTGIAWNNEIDDKNKIFIRNIFENSGKVFEFSEDYLDIFLALTSSAPAIVALIIDALADGGLSGGLTKKLSKELVIDMIYGTILMIKDLNVSPSDLKDMVTSPAGTTIAALRILEKKGFRSALIEAILGAMNKSKEFK